jgi:hypothetical protein
VVNVTLEGRQKKVSIESQLVIANNLKNNSIQVYSVPEGDTQVIEGDRKASGEI